MTYPKIWTPFLRLMPILCHDLSRDRCRGRHRGRRTWIYRTRPGDAYRSFLVGVLFTQALSQGPKGLFNQGQFGAFQQKLVPIM